MEHLSWSRLTLIAGVTLGLSYVIGRLAIGSGYTPSAIPLTVAAVCLIGGVLALVFAWPVRQYQRGKNPGIDALRAARAAVFAQASAYAGVLLGSGFVGYALAVAGEWSHEPRREIAVTALVAALGAVALLVGGAVAEHWCRTKPPDDASPQAPAA
jgi:hypothetical protein